VLIFADSWRIVLKRVVFVFVWLSWLGARAPVQPNKAPVQIRKVATANNEEAAVKQAAALKYQESENKSHF